MKLGCDTKIDGAVDTHAIAAMRSLLRPATHILLFLVYSLAGAAAVLLWHPYCSCQFHEMNDSMHKVSSSSTSSSNATSDPHIARHHGRRLVAADFNAEFGRRLTFQTFVEEDVVLGRSALNSYVSRALTAAGLKRALAEGTTSKHKPVKVDTLVRQFSLADFPFHPAYAAHGHHQLGQAPWSGGRDQFMHLVRYGLRPNHYVLEVGCGGLAAGQHVIRYLLSGRYYCIEADEYLLRAAIEYEVPAAGLIHKHPRFRFDTRVDIDALLTTSTNARPGEHPSVFDFIIVQQPMLERSFDKVVSRVVRYLRPRQGRLTLPTPPASQLLQRLGLQQMRSEMEQQVSSAAEAGADPSREACPFSLTCSYHLYHT